MVWILLLRSMARKKGENHRNNWVGNRIKQGIVYVSRIGGAGLYLFIEGRIKG
jgi:hypothetical protein